MYLYAVNRVVVEAMESFILLRITLLESLCAFFGDGSVDELDSILHKC